MFKQPESAIAAPKSLSGASRKFACPKLERKGLYMLLGDKELPDEYHWGLLVATDGSSGISFHRSLIGQEWKLIIEHKNLTEASDLLAALKLGVVEDISDKWVQRMKESIRAVRVQGELTCRIWALTALYELANEGFIGMMAEWERIRSIELEAKYLAQDAWVTKRALVARSKWSVP
ncbi:hypothetical protein PHISCL_05241 [Aspergillus sclerotialis]|uniref:Uncharacterized protein n=1 Tax=Aspergillus sclerotialis TaxID=2070753 RepID=A0A3A2ZZD4_9EURO|nr:hypothetical protein PHISCL_05241 [Aspergillus sclerotialis]